MAEQMVAIYPQIAAEVLRLEAEKTRLPEHDKTGEPYWYAGECGWKPVTLIRGIAEETFDPEYYPDDGRAHMAELSSFANVIPYAFAELDQYEHADKQHGLMFEFQVPRFLLRPGNRWRAPVLRVQDVPSFTPFIKRIGVVPYDETYRNYCCGGRATGQKLDDWLVSPDRVKWQPVNSIESFIKKRDER